MIFKGDPSTALEKTRRRIVDVAANIESLKAKRAELLATPDDDNVADIRRVNGSIEAEEANKAIYEAKAVALAEECRKATYAEREQQRQASIKKIAAKLKKREAVAAELQACIERVGELYSKLTTPDEAEIEWPFARPGHGFAALDQRGVNREISWSLHGICSQYRFPEPSSVGLGVIGVRAEGIDGIVRANNENIIARSDWKRSALPMICLPRRPFSDRRQHRHRSRRFTYWRTHVLRCCREPQG